MQHFYTLTATQTNICTYERHRYHTLQVMT